MLKAASFSLFLFLCIAIHAHSSSFACPNIDIIWTNISCNGAADGTAEAQLTGGSGFFVYAWSTGDTTAAITGLTPGSYFVNVTDTVENCNVFGSIVITEPQPLALVPTNTLIGCTGASDGSVSVSASGGTQPYNYSWSSGHTTDSVFSLNAGQYIITVTDTNNCISVDSTVVGTSMTFAMEFDSIQNASCANMNDGYARIQVNGGSGSYNYSWSNGDSLSYTDSLLANTYMLTVLDTTNGCMLIDSVLITEPPSLIVDIMTEQATSCFNICDGSSSVQALGGTAPYEYLWDVNANSQVSSLAIDLCPGPYIVSIQDDNDCTVLGNVNIVAADTIMLQDSIVAVSCFGFTNGSIHTEIINGNSPFTYQWADTNFVLSHTGAALLDLLAGQYTVNITDTFGCHLRDTFLISQPELLTTALTSSNVSCFGGNDGEILQNVNGGTQPYSYAWNNGSDIRDINSLTAGSYSVLITDTNNCVLLDSALINEPALLEVNSIIDHVSCMQESDGMITLFIQGGNGGYSFDWNNGANTQNIEELAGGFYTVNVSDVLGCNFFQAYEVLVGQSECINIPTAFTPNGDGMNDEWVLRNISLYSGNNVKVLNRWGQIVHESSNYTNGWDGRYKGEDLPAGTYYYLVDLNDGKQMRSGPITLVR